MSAVAPAAALLFLLTAATASLAHALWGRHWLQIPIFWLTAGVGCLVAYGLSLHLPIPLALPTPAGVPVLEATLLAWLLLGVVARIRV